MQQVQITSASERGLYPVYSSVCCLPGSTALPGIRELTVRSIMGGYGGNAGLLSAWFDEDEWEWKFEFENCALGTQYVWWGIHALDLVTIGLGLAYAIVCSLGAGGEAKKNAAETEKTKVAAKENGSAVGPEKPAVVKEVKTKEPVSI